MPKSPAGKVIGNVKVKVLPDTSGFGGDVRKYLRELEASPRAPKLKIGLKLDTTGFKGEVLRTVQELNREIKDSDAYKIKYRAGVSKVGLAEAVKEAQRQMQTLAKGVDKIDFAADLSEREQEKLKRTIEGIDADLDVGVSEVSKRKVATELAVLARDRWVTLRVRVEQASLAKAQGALFALTGARGFKELGEDLWDSFKDIDKLAPKIGAVSLAISGLTASLMQSTSNLLTFGSSLASIGPAALALPGIFGGLAIGIGAMVVNMKDFNNYFPKFAIGMGRNAKAGSFWQDIRKNMSANFWRNAEKPMRSFVQSILPQFGTGLEKISTSLGKFTGNLATAFKGVFNGPLKSMFADLDKSILIAGRHTHAFADIIRRLGEVGAGELPRLADWFGSISDNFDSWLKKKGKSGLADMIHEATDALQDLGTVIAKTSSLLASLARAAEAGGGSTLATLADTMTKAAKAAKSSGFQKTLSQAFRAAHDGMQELGKGIGDSFKDLMVRLTNTLSDTLPIAGRTIGKLFNGIFTALNQPQVQKGIDGAFKGLERAVNTLTPALKPLARGLASVFSAAGQVATNLASVLAPALSGIGNGLTHLAPAVADFSSTLAVPLKALGPLIENVADLLAGLLRSVNNLLAPFKLLGEAIGALPDPLKDVLSKAVAFAAFVGGAAFLGGIVTTKITIIRTQLAELAGQAATTSVEMGKLGLAAQGFGGIKAMGRSGWIGAAGAGALALGGLADTTTKTGKAFSVLNDAAGGALMGFTVSGNPIGALIGGAGAGLLGLYQALHHTKDGFKTATRPARTFAVTLDQVTGAVTRTTQAMARKRLADAGAFAQGKALGLTERQVMDAFNGRGNALKRLNEIIKQGAGANNYYIDSLGNMVPATRKGYNAQYAEQLLGTLERLTGQRRKDAAEIIRVNALEAKRGELLRGLPKSVRTKIDLGEINQNITKVRALSKSLSLTPKQIRIVARAAGIDPASKAIKALIKQAKDAGRQKPVVKVDLKDNASPKLKKTGSDAVKVARDASVNASKAAANAASQVARSGQKAVAATTDAAKKATNKLASMRQAGYQYGSLLMVGLAAGISANAGAAISAALAVSQRVSAAVKKHNQIHSPSRLYRRYGGFMMQGMADGINASGDAVVSAARTVSKKTGKAVQKAANEARARIKTLHKTLVKLFAGGFLNKIVSGDASKLASQMSNLINALSAAHQKGATKIVKSYGKQLTALTKKFEANKQLLENAKQAWKSYHDTVVATIRDLGSPAALDPSLQTFDTIIENLQDAKTKAVRWLGDLSRLVKLGLNKTTYDQLVSAGPEAALAAADAILKSGKAGITQINSLQSQINKAAGKAGTTAANYVTTVMTSTGAQLAVNIIKGMKSKQKALVDAMKRVAKTLRKALEKELNIPKLIEDAIKKSNKKPVRAPKPKSNTTKSASRAVETAVTRGLAGTTVVNNNRTINYYAADNSSLPQEDFFAALTRARSVAF